MHFAILDRRLRALGHSYGALPAHGGLWQAAEATAGDVLARLAVVPMVLEARALDVSPATIARFESVGDAQSARLLARILRDEINHVAIGVRWFRAGCATTGVAPAEHWRVLVDRYFAGVIKPPFNDSARAAAGLTKDFYAGLAR
ncbi:MAG: rhamnosyltransferase [Sphingomonas bacterium]|nr:rhamnosyltransferase [Sphingomonas bacterium]